MAGRGHDFPHRGDETQPLELAQPTVAGNERDTVPTAQVKGGGLALVRAHEDAGRMDVEGGAKEGESVCDGRPWGPACWRGIQPPF